MFFFFALSCREVAGSSGGRQRRGERRVRASPGAQLPELLQPGFREGADAAGQRSSVSPATCG